MEIKVTGCDLDVTVAVTVTDQVKRTVHLIAIG
jgi:hypothetical protein